MFQQRIEELTCRHASPRGINAQPSIWLRMYTCKNRWFCFLCFDCFHDFIISYVSSVTHYVTPPTDNYKLSPRSNELFLQTTRHATARCDINNADENEVKREHLQRRNPSSGSPAL